MLLLVVVLVAALSGLAWLVWREPAATPTAELCSDAEPVVVGVVPAMTSAMDLAAEALSDADACLAFDVREMSAPAVAAALTGATTDAPGLWVPDSPVWLRQLEAAGISVEVVAPALASTPVTLVSGPSVELPGSWGAAMSSGRLLMRDPFATGAGALTLLAPQAERPETGLSGEQTQALLVPVAQRYGAQAAAGEVEDVALDELGAASTELIPATEQEYLGARRANDVLTLVTPRTGAPLLTYPLVATTDSEETVAVGVDLAAWFGTAEGGAALRSADLRVPDGTPMGEGVGAGAVPLLASANPAAVEGSLRTWRVLSVPSSVLAVFDASGSMDFAAGDATRMELAVAAADTALGVFPGHARIGMWAFSIDQGGPGQDWRELAPMRRLDQAVGGRTHLEVLRAGLPQMLELTEGGTGLYDTTLAAYRRAVESYDPNYFNSVILLTDGANDDPGSISLEDLLEELAAAADPQKPVRIIGVGISGDADLPSLRTIAEATGGSAYLAENPEDILDVFSQALLAR